MILKNEDNLLSVTEAALYMGITKELLYAYIKNAPKKSKGEDRKLVPMLIKGDFFFQKEELDSFDNYLKTPWSESANTRPPIPTYIQDHLKAEIQGHCPITGKEGPLEYAHIIPYSESLNHHHHNIIRISQELHTNVDKGLIPREILTETKRNLIQNLKQKITKDIPSSHSNFEVPTPHSIYIGRKELIRELVFAMSDTQLVVIEGMGGIGKTQLLIQAINSTAEYYNPVIWMDMEQVETFSDFI